jgi:hypothetical protein
MKKIITLFVLLTSTLFYAQSSGITYQAVLYNPSGEILPGNNNTNAVLSNKDICLRFSITDAQTSLEYQETQKVKTDEFGMVNLLVGSGSQIGGYATNFTAIVWSSSTKKLQVAIDVTGTCSNFIEVSDQNFSAVPFAYASKTAENVTGIVAIANGGTGANTVSGAKTNLGLNNVDNTSDLNKPISTATQTALNTKENTIAAGTTSQYFRGDKTWQTLDKTVVGLSNVDNTSDANKPISTATQTALNTKENTIAAGTTAQYYRGDKTWQTLDKTTVGLSNVDNTADANKPVSTATQAALDTKEDAANKSTLTTLGNSDVLFPTQNAVKTYVDNQISTGVVDASTTVKGKIQLAGDLEGTADTPLIKTAAITVAKLADDAVETTKIKNGSVITDKIADNAVTNAKIGQIVSVNKGGTGSNMSNAGAGYVKQATNGANFTTVSSIPVAHVDGAVSSVNGVTPVDGNVSVFLGRVFQGDDVDPAQATSVITINNDANLLNNTKESDIYIVVGNSNNANNGRTFIFNGTAWLEVATNLAATDSRYVNITGDVLEGNLEVPATKKIIIADAPSNATDAANKAYVDTKVDVANLSGTTNFVPKFSAAKTLADSSIFDNGKVGIGTTSPANTLEIKQGTAGNSGLRFTNLNSSSTATTSATKVLGLNSTGDVILTNIPGTQNIVDFSTATPTTSGVVFTPNTPTDQSVIFQSAIDNSMWTYNGSTYVSYTAPATTAWNLANTTNDAGKNKTSSIWRSGNVGIGTNNPFTKLHIQGIQTTLGANANATMLRMSRPTYSGYKWGSVAQFNLGTYDDGFSPGNSKSRLDLVLANADETLSTTPTMTWLANGNVGIGTTAPTNKLEITQGTAGNSGLRFTNLNSSSTATTSASKVLGLNSTGDVILTNIPGTQNIVDFSTATPTTSGVVFTPPTPADESVIYQSTIDNSMWTYNGTTSTYVSYTAPASTAWNLANTNNDAGSTKTSSIWRSGNVGIGTNNPFTKLHVQGLSATKTINADAQVLRLSRPSVSSVKWDNIAQFNLGSYSNLVDANSRLDLVLNNTDNNIGIAPTMTWQANGNVGINNTAPSAPLVVQGVAGTGALKLIAPSVAAGDNWWLGFGHGTTSTDANDRARIGAEIIAGGAGRLFFTTGLANTQKRAMFIDESQRVGIGTSAPTGQLEVATTSGSSAIFRRGNTSGGASNIYLQRTQNADPNVNTAGSYATDVIGKVIFSMANGTGYPTNGNASIESYYTNAQTATNAAGGLAFKTTPSATVTSTERMRIDHNGNIGIGNFSATAPSAQLHTTGSVRFAGAGTPSAGKVLTSDATGNATWQPVNAATTVANQTANFTLTAADSGSVIVVNSASLVTVTVPSTFSAGFYCQIIQSGAGQVNVVGSGGITISSALGTKSRAMGSSIGIMVTNSTTAFVSGDSAF